MNLNQIAQGIAPRGHTNNAPATFEGLEQVFQNVVAVVLGFAGIALFIMFIMGALSYINSGGDAKKSESARNTLTYAVMGIVFIALAYLFLRFIAALTGVNTILNFDVYI